MHPAKSVIFFTTASGTGYGLVAMLGILSALGLFPADQAFGFAAFAVSLALIVSGLLSSTLHLGHPERAWRALSQWRSSWLSREGVLAILSFAPIGLFAIWWVFLSDNTGIAVVFGILSSVMAILTVYCTAMIYASLRTIPAWHNSWTIASYLGLAAMTGAVLLNGLVAAWSWPVMTTTTGIALVATTVGLLIKLAYWAAVAKPQGDSTAETATGLGSIGKVSLLESPHSSDNYLMKEMGFRIARKHAGKLRTIALVTGFVVPALLLAVALVAGGIAGVALSLLTIIPMAIGIIIERWLFFAEARHAVMLYYGTEAI